MIFDELADKYAESCQFDKIFKSFKAYIIPILQAGFGGRTRKRSCEADDVQRRNQPGKGAVGVVAERVAFLEIYFNSQRKFIVQFGTKIIKVIYAID